MFAYSWIHLKKLSVVSKLKVEFNYSTIASTIQLFSYSGEGRERSWRVRAEGEGVRGESVRGGGIGVCVCKGMKQGRGRKNRWACVIPPPLTVKILKGEGDGRRGITHTPLFFHTLPCLIPLHSLPPSTPTLTLQDLPLPSPE